MLENNIIIVATMKQSSKQEVKWEMDPQVENISVLIK